MVASACKAIEGLLAIHEFTVTRDAESTQRQSPSTLAWEQRKLDDCFEFLKNNTLSRTGLNGENGTARNVHYGDVLIKFGDCLDGERSDLHNHSCSLRQARHP